MNKNNVCTAIVLAGGQGRRMGTSVRKQYLQLEGFPLLYYSLKTFEESALIDRIILVVGKSEVETVRNQMVVPWRFEKVEAITEGGKERYDSVWNGLKELQRLAGKNEQGYVFIHDGARPFVEEEIIARTYEAAAKHRACVAGMPSKDTVKLVDEDGCAKETPNRNYVWTVQTPQVFEKSLIIEAYSRLMGEDSICVTDDAMVVEQQMQVPVKLVEGSYENIKITTPEDMEIAKVFIKRQKEKNATIQPYAKK